jgi:hypothetical protein
MEEIRAGKVQWTDPTPQPSAVEVASQLLDKAMQPGPEE